MANYMVISVKKHELPKTFFLFRVDLKKKLYFCKTKPSSSFQMITSYNTRNSLIITPSRNIVANFGGLRSFIFINLSSFSAGLRAYAEGLFCLINK